MPREHSCDSIRQATLIHLESVLIIFISITAVIEGEE